MATLTTVTLCTPLNIQSLPKTHQLSKVNKQTNRVRSNACNKVSCKANDNKNNNNMDELKLIQNPNNNDNNNNNNATHLYDRRNMLIGLGGMYGAAMTLGGAPSDAVAAPVVPDVTACNKLIDSQNDASGCCPPKFIGKDIKSFKFKDYPNPVMRVRRPAHELDQDSIDDYKRATAIMKSLPLSDPRSFIQQARVHCAYCDGAYPVADHPHERFFVHGSWLFASFHRWYLYFYERILGKLINKPGFALPYWNWDHPQGMEIPYIFKDMDSPLYDPNRNPSHVNKVIDLSYSGKDYDYDYSSEKQIEDNLEHMKKQVLDKANPSVFFGGAYCPGPEPKVAGALELSPHNNVHVWTGSNTIRGNQDMGVLWSAARDPIFFCHHSNVDRMWSIWKNGLPTGPRPDLHHQDYLNAYFIFYDENAKPVKVYVKDSFDTEKLGYRYQWQELPWVYVKSRREAGPRKAKTVTQDIVTVFPKKLDSVIRTNIERADKEEVLVIEFKLGMPSSFVKFDVYVNDDYDNKPDEKTKITPEYAGSFTSLGHRGEEDETHKSALRLEITALLEEISATNDDTIQVTIVPKIGTEGLEITRIYFEE